MLAQRTNKILRQLFSHILISANRTSPDGLSILCLPHFLRLGLNMVHIVFIGCRSIPTQHFHIRDLTNEHGMRAKILRLVNLYGNIGIGSFGNIINTVLSSDTGCVFCKFIDFPSCLEPEMLKQIK